MRLLSSLIRHRPWLPRGISALCFTTSVAACSSQLAARPAHAANAREAALTTKVVVQPGETLWRISQRFGLTVDELARHNNISDPTKLSAGVVLRVPGAQEEAKPQSSKPSRLKSEPTKAAPTPRAPTTGLQREPKKEEIKKPASPRENAKPSYPLRWPVNGRVIKRFGTSQGVRHDGIDIVVPEGTRVRAAAAGKVVFSGKHGGYGNLIILRHDSGLVTVYAHNKRNLVRKGAKVSAGQDIAFVGEAARTGIVKLHFEVREGVRAQNPMKYLPP